MKAMWIDINRYQSDEGKTTSTHLALHFHSISVQVEKEIYYREMHLRSGCDECNFWFPGNNQQPYTACFLFEIPIGDDKSINLDRGDSDNTKTH